MAHVGPTLIFLDRLIDQSNLSIFLNDRSSIKIYQEIINDRDHYYLAQSTLVLLNDLFENHLISKGRWPTPWFFLWSFLKKMSISHRTCLYERTEKPNSP